MKYTTIITLSALLLGSAGGFAQDDPPTAFSKPSGFVTQTLKAGQFNLMGLTLHKLIIVSGAFETVASLPNTLTDTQADFTTSLTDGVTYILEITENTADPSLVGTIQEITTWTTTTLTTIADLGDDGLAGETTGGANDGAKYQLREAATLESIFGIANTAGLKGGSFSEADVIWRQDITEPSGYAKYYYKAGGFGSEEWRNHRTDMAVVPSSITMVYTDGFFVQSQSATDTELVITGAVKTEASVLAITSQFSLISGVYPVGATLLTSGLEATIVGGSFSEADIIWIPKQNGGYDKYYYKSGGFGSEEWRNHDTDMLVGVDVDLTSGMILQRQNGTQGNITSTPPASYENL